MPAEGLGFRVWAFQHRDEQKNSRRITVEERGGYAVFHVWLCPGTQETALMSTPDLYTVFPQRTVILGSLLQALVRYVGLLIHTESYRLRLRGS